MITKITVNNFGTIEIEPQIRILDLNTTLFIEPPLKPSKVTLKELNHILDLTNDAINDGLLKHNDKPITDQWQHFSQSQIDHIRNGSGILYDCHTDRLPIFFDTKISH